jgi:hypothetical protein
MLGLFSDVDDMEEAEERLLDHVETWSSSASAGVIDSLFPTG